MHELCAARHLASMQSEEQIAVLPAGFNLQGETGGSFPPSHLTSPQEKLPDEKHIIITLLLCGTTNIPFVYFNLLGNTHFV